MKISITKAVDAHFFAEAEHDEVTITGKGNTPKDALGDLVLKHAELFCIEVTIKHYNGRPYAMGDKRGRPARWTKKSS